MHFSACLVIVSTLMLAACATPERAGHGQGGTEDTWHPVTLPGKRVTEYTPEIKAGRHAVRAWADASSSLWRRKMDVPAHGLGEVTWSWWVDGPVAGADLADADLSDAAAQVMFAFDGDHSGLSQRNRMMFELARTVTGEAPPYATLVYVWANKAPVGSIIVGPRTDRIRRIVLDSGVQGVRNWREHRRNLAADFERAFGEAPGRLIGIAMMTDADNTRSKAQAWYGPIELVK